MTWGIKYLAGLIKKVVDFTLVGIIDNLLGVVISVAKSLFIFSVILWVTGSANIYLPSQWIHGSDFYDLVVSIAPVIFEVINGLLPFFGDIFENMQELSKRSSVIAAI